MDNPYTIGDALPAKGVFVNNAWIPSDSGEEIDVIRPADGRSFALIAAGNKVDVNRAVLAARAAYEKGTWGKLTARDRGRLLHKLSFAILDNIDGLTALEASDTGKPIKQARADVEVCARYFEFYAGAADKFHGDTIPFLNGFFAATERGPHGVTGHIIPWNYPAQMFARTLAPSLAIGNATVIKPAEDACLTPLALVELAASVGFPEGAINLVPGFGAAAGAALISHPGIDFLSFTGSPQIGQLVQIEAAKNHITCTLELGGKSPQIVFGDVDLDAALPTLVAAIVQNAGQTCSAGSRLLVQKSGYDRIVGALADRFSQLHVGTPDMDLDLGPIISAKQLGRVRDYCDTADSQSVRLIAEGQLAKNLPSGGFYMTPKLYGPVPHINRLSQEEVFGPILSAIPFEDEAEAVALANGTEFSLLAGIWTSDAKRSMRVARAVRAGQVYINAYGAGGGVELPFGGRRKSGHGREKGFAALYDFSVEKTIVVKHD